MTCCHRACPIAASLCFLPGRSNKTAWRLPTGASTLRARWRRQGRCTIPSNHMPKHMRCGSLGALQPLHASIGCIASMRGADLLACPVQSGLTITAQLRVALRVRIANHISLKMISLKMNVCDTAVCMQADKRSRVTPEPSPASLQKAPPNPSARRGLALAAEPSEIIEEETDLQPRQPVTRFLAVYEVRGHRSTFCRCLAMARSSEPMPCHSCHMISVARIMGASCQFISKFRVAGGEGARET